MKILVKFLIDMQSGDYEVTYENITTPGQPFDYQKVRAAIAAVFKSVDIQVIQDIDTEAQGFRPEKKQVDKIQADIKELQDKLKKLD